MHLLTPTSSLGRAEYSLLFKLRFACMVSRRADDVMNDPRVKFRAQELLNQLRRSGCSAQFREKFMPNPERGRYSGAALCEYYHLTVEQGFNHLYIVRTKHREPITIEVHHAAA